MDQELLNVAWVTAAVVAVTGATMTALALTCKALQRCYIRCRRQRSQLLRRQQPQSVAAVSMAVTATTASASPPPHNDSFEKFLQLSFNSQPTPATTSASNGPQQLAGRSPRGRSSAGLRSPAEPGSSSKTAQVVTGLKQQHQLVLDPGLPMTFEIRSAEDSDENVEAVEDFSCDDSRQWQQKPSRQAASTRTSGVPSSFYDHGAYDTEWPPASSSRLAALGSESWHPGRQQQQQQGRRAHIFFGRGAAHGSGRYAGNL